MEIRILQGTEFKANSTCFQHMPYDSRILVYTDHKSYDTVLTFDYEALRSFIRETAKHAGFTLMEAAPFANYQCLVDSAEQASAEPSQPSGVDYQVPSQHEAAQAVPQ